MHRKGLGLVCGIRGVEDKRKPYRVEKYRSVLERKSWQAVEYEEKTDGYGRKTLEYPGEGLWYVSDIAGCEPEKLLFK